MNVITVNDFYETRYMTMEDIKLHQQAIDYLKGLHPDAVFRGGNVASNSSSVLHAEDYRYKFFTEDLHPDPGSTFVSGVSNGFCKVFVGKYLMVNNFFIQKVLDSVLFIMASPF